MLGYAILIMWIKLRHMKAPTERQQPNHEGKEKNKEK